MGILKRAIRFLGVSRNAPPEPGSLTPQAAQPDRGRAAAAALYQDALGCLAQDDAAAAACLLQAISLCHDYAEAHFLLGQIHRRHGRAEDAADCYILAAHFRPDLHVAHLGLGLLALDAGRPAEAIEHLERAIELAPDDARAHGALGAALLKLQKPDECVARLRRALELDPNLAEAHNNLGYVLFREFEQFDAGARHVERALALAPDDEGVLCTWTMVLQQQGRFDELLRLSDRLLAANPALHEVRVNRGLVLLTQGEFQRGWEDYEARKFLPPFAQGSRRCPEWKGESLAGRKLLVYSEQGIGDEIMFSSCLPEVLRATEQCIVECSPKLEKLFRRSFARARVMARQGLGVAAGGDIPAHEAEVAAAIGSLPHFLRNSRAAFPIHQGYLRADEVRTAYWKMRLEQLGPKLKVGLAWRGGLPSTRRSLRSMPLDDLLPVLRCDFAAFVSLQHTDVAAELNDLGARHGVAIHHWQDALDDLDETAALVCALDLVITVQTAAAHLAGALGKTAWVMLTHIPEWRYMAHGESMAWYPSLRLFRQSAPGDWAGVIRRVVASLDGLSAASDTPAESRHK